MFILNLCIGIRYAKLYAATNIHVQIMKLICCLFCLFVSFDSLRLINNLSVIKGRDVLFDHGCLSVCMTLHGKALRP